MDSPSADDVDGETPEQRSDRHASAKQHAQVANLVVRNVQLLQADMSAASAVLSDENLPPRDPCR